MLKIASKISVFLSISFFFFLIAGVLISNYGKLELHLLINQYNTPFFDIFFKGITYVGEGYFALFIIPILYFTKKTEYLPLGILSCLFAGILAQIIKNFLFPDALRPTAIFEEGILHLVPGVEMAKHFSFVSGHSSSVMALFMFLSIVYNSKFLQILFAIIALLTAYSRVYLSQHFMIDILAGSLLGIFSVFNAYKLLLYYKNFLFTKKKINKY